MKKPRKPEVIEVRFRLLTAATNAEIRNQADRYARSVVACLGSRIVRKPTVERVGKR